MKRYSAEALSRLLKGLPKLPTYEEYDAAEAELHRAFVDLQELSNSSSIQGGPKTKRHRSKTVVQTDPLFMAAVRREFGEPWGDLAATPENTQAFYFFTGADNSLTQNWANLNAQVRAPMWLNPPFDPIAPWVAKAHSEARIAMGVGAYFQLLLLCPLAVGTNWWRDHVEPWATPIATGRQTFVGHKDPFPKDLALCVYQSRPAKIPGKIYRWDWANTALSAEIREALS